MKSILVTLCIIIAFLNARGANKYVSALGNDANSGSLAAPYLTIAKVNSIFSTLSPGDSVLFRRGDTFIGQIIISRSGTLAAPIIVSAYGTGNKPVLTSLRDMTGWTQSSTNIWTSAANGFLGANVKIVLDDNVLQRIGRFPNLNTPNAGYLLFESSTANSITDNQLLNTPNWAGATATVRVNSTAIETNRITAHAGTRLTFAIAFSSAPVPIGGYFFQNDLRTLDQQGEYFYNPTTKRIAMYSTSIPTNIQASSISTLIRSVNFSYIHLDNLNIKGANDSAIAVYGGSGVLIKNCAVNFTGVNGISVVNHGNLIIRNDSVTTSLNNGIFFNGSPNAIIRSNYIAQTYQISGMGQGLSITGNGIRTPNNSTGSIIDSNKVIASGYCGIWFDGNDIIVKNNYVDTFCNIKTDGGGIYTVPSAGVLKTGQQIINNIVLNGIGATAGSHYGSNILAHNIYLDDNASNVLVQGNTVAYGDGGIFLHRGHNNTVRLNTVYGCLKQMYILADNQTSQAVTGIVLRRNIFFAKETTQLTIIVSTNASGYGILDSNYYARPINDNLTMRNYSSNISLAMWKTAYPAYDINSAKSPRAVTSTNQLLFLYNPTSSVIQTILVGNWVDVTNAPYNGLISLQPYTSLILIATGALITPTITWNNPAAITYPTALSGTQLNATSGGVPGTFAYTPASTTNLNAGANQTLSVVFTPTDGTTYSTASKSVLITVNKAAATMTYSNLTQTYTGLPLAPTITTSPSGLTTINTLYDGVGATPIDAGVYSVTSALTNTNYTAPNISGTFTINKETATLNVSNLAQTYNGSPKPITVVTSPVGLSGVTILYNGSSTVPTNAGTYTIDVTLTNTNYAATPVSTTLVISKATPTVSWSNPSAITFGTALSGTQLNATASVAGVFTYTPASGTILNAGTTTLRVDFVPTDATNYNSVSNTTVDLVVNQAAATVSLSNLAQTYDGFTHEATVTTNPVNLQTISVTYNGSATLPIAVGTYAVVATLTNANYTAAPGTGDLVISSSAANIYITDLVQVYTGSPLPVTITTNPPALSHTVTYNASATVPTNVGSYEVIATITGGVYFGVDTQTLVISKATPILTWANPSDISFGTALSGTQLNASANITGSFVYSPISGTVLNVGANQNLSTTFTPTDAANYNSVSKIVSINVTATNATLSLSNLTQVYDGTLKPVTVSSSPSGLSGIVVTYNGSATVPTNAGNYTIAVSLVNDNYVASNIGGTLVIAKASPVLTWAAPAPIKSGTPLSSIQLNATSNIAGTFVYNPVSGYVTGTGTRFLSATFTPSSSNYNVTTISVSISTYGNPFRSALIRNGNIIYVEIP